MSHFKKAVAEERTNLLKNIALATKRLAQLEQFEKVALALDAPALELITSVSVGYNDIMIYGEFDQDNSAIRRIMGKLDKDGKATKLAYGGHIATTARLEDNLSVTLGADRPATCKLVEEEVLVPARVEKRVRIVCTEEA